MANIRTVVYESVDPLTPNQRFVAFLVQDAWQTVEGKRTGLKVPERLPVYFLAGTAAGAENAAMAFWNAETAKEAAKKENIRKAVEARKRAA